MELETMIFRFVVAFLLTFLFGLQRQRSHKPIGFGTFVFVAIGACGLTVTVLNLGESYLPLLGAIVTGVGFLGAGALIKNSDKIFGFTTAASIWLFAIFGMLIGLGQFAIGLTLYAFVWIVVLFDKRIENRWMVSYRRKIKITCDEFVDKKEIAEILAKYCKKFHLLHITLEKKPKSAVITYLVDGRNVEIEHLLKEFYSKSWCLSVAFE